MTIGKALLQIFWAAAFAPVALLMEFSCAALLNWIGFGWPLHLLLDAGEGLYWQLVKNGFYAYPSGFLNLFVGLDFALKLDLTVNFLLFVGLFSSLPELPKRWIPLMTELRENKKRYFRLN